MSTPTPFHGPTAYFSHPVRFAAVLGVQFLAMT